jgi:hypothetical protein
MKVNAYKSIDVEVDVEVSLDDCINEMLSIADEEGYRLKLSAIDGATKVLEKISPLVLEQLSNDATRENALELISGRLAEWIATINRRTR